MLLLMTMLVATLTVHPTINLRMLRPDPRIMEYLRSEDENFVGFFRIPKYRIYVPIYHAVYEWEYAVEIAQAYTDREHTAVYMDGWTPYKYVADHVHQDFARLSEVEVGDIAIIDWYDGTRTEYFCTEADVGLYARTELYDCYGVPFEDWQCDFMSYTCYHAIPDGVFICKWDLL